MKIGKFRVDWPRVTCPSGIGSLTDPNLDNDYGVCRRHRHPISTGIVCFVPAVHAVCAGAPFFSCLVSTTCCDTHCARTHTHPLLPHVSPASYGAGRSPHPYRYAYQSCCIPQLWYHTANHLCVQILSLSLSLFVFFVWNHGVRTLRTCTRPRGRMAND
jgi:hypothetical protein